MVLLSLTAIEITAIVVVSCIILSFPVMFHLFGAENRCGRTNWDKLKAWFKNKFNKN